MSEIQSYLEQIATAQKGKDVRQAIHNSIQACYEDGKAGSTDLIARQGIKECQQDIQRTKNIMNGLNMEFVESLDSIDSTITGSCDVYRMNNIILVSYSIEVGAKYTGTPVFEYTEDIPVCQKDIAIKNGEVYVQINAGSRSISVVHPASGTASVGGEFIFTVEPEQGEFHFNTKVVDELPTGDQIDTNCIYFEKNNFDAGDNQYTEYVYINGSWEAVGTSNSESTLVDVYKGNSGCVYLYQMPNSMMLDFANLTCGAVTFKLPNGIEAIRDYTYTLAGMTITVSGKTVTLTAGTNVNGIIEFVTKSKLQAILHANGSREYFACKTDDSIALECIELGGSGSYTNSFNLVNLETQAPYTIQEGTGNTCEWLAGANGTREFYCNVTDGNGKTARTNKIIGFTTDNVGVMYTDEYLLGGYASKVNENFKFTVIPVDKSIKYKYQFAVKSATGSEVVVKQYSDSNEYTGAWKSAGTKTIKVYMKDAAENIVEINSITVNVK